jgi:hypothetical protein
MAASISGAGMPFKAAKRSPLVSASSARLCKQFIYDRPQVSGIQVIYFSDSDLILCRYGQTSCAT